MAATPATYFTDVMTLLKGNTGGGVQSLPAVTLSQGKQRQFISRLTLASQTSGSVIGIARIPLFAALLGITLSTDTTLGSSTLAFGNAGDSNAAIYGAAATYTSTNALTKICKTATLGVPITQGYDCVTGLPTNYASGPNAAPPNPGGYGSLYEDVTATIAAANLPSSGNLVVIVDFVID